MRWAEGPRATVKVVTAWWQPQPKARLRSPDRRIQDDRKV